MESEHMKLDIFEPTQDKYESDICDLRLIYSF